MNIVIIGGGKLGYSLAINMLDRDFRVNVIEKNKVRGNASAGQLESGQGGNLCPDPSGKFKISRYEPKGYSIATKFPDCVCGSSGCLNDTSRLHGSQLRR